MSTEPTAASNESPDQELAQRLSEAAEGARQELLALAVTAKQAQDEDTVDDLLRQMWGLVMRLDHWWVPIRQLDGGAATPRAIQTPVGPAICIGTTPNSAQAGDALLGVPQGESTVAAMPLPGALDFVEAFVPRGLNLVVIDVADVQLFGEVSQLRARWAAAQA